MIITSTQRFHKQAQNRPAAVALGYFDGVHAAHRDIIGRVVGKKSEGMLACVHTFSTPPKPNSDLKILTPPEVKKRLLSQLGVDFEVIDDFSEALMKMAPDDFFKTCLVKGLGAKFIAAGYDYRFGYQKAGSADTLIELGKQYGIGVEVVKPIQLNGQIVSSTYIRYLLEHGDVKKASSYLGAPFCVMGKVLAGRRIGRTMNIKTANLKLDPAYALPDSGVYVTLCRIEQDCYRSLTNIGNNPTVGGTDTTIETHILDFDGEIYEKELTVEFIDRIRGEIRFPDKEALRRQIESDIAYTRVYLYP